MIALDLAKYIVTKCVKDSCAISNLQLQKILYFIQKDFLCRGEFAFLDAIEAWPFGPVVPAVYYHFCIFGSMSITTAYEGITIEAKDRARIDPIVEAKRVLPPWDLVEDTHRKNGAWDQIYQDGAGNRKVIPPDLIRVAG